MTLPRISVAILLLTGVNIMAEPAAAQSSGPGPVGATDHLGNARPTLGGEPGTSHKTYLDPNRRAPLALPPDSPAFLQAIAANISLWREKSGEAALCPDSRVVVEGVHLYEMGVRGIAYYRFTGDGRSSVRCGPGELGIVKLADGDWYVPAWGARLARP